MTVETFTDYEEVIDAHIAAPSVFPVALEDYLDYESVPFSSESEEGFAAVEVREIETWY